MDKTIVSLAKDLIAIPSITEDLPQAVAVLDVVKRELADYEFTPFVYKHFPSVLYSNHGKDIKEFKVILNAHLDVVPAPQTQFNPIEKNGRLYGKGAFDMKAAAAVEILLFKELANQVTFPLGLQLVTDEEITGDGTSYQVQQGIKADFILIGECNSNFQVETQAKGRNLMKLTVNGQRSHSAYPWHGKNAIIRMYEVLDLIIKAFPVPTVETNETTVSITKIETTNKSSNTIPDHCTAYLDVRYNPKDADTIVEKIRALLPNDVIFEPTDVRTHHFVEPENSYVKMLQQITKDIRGEDLPLRSAHGTSDAVFYTQIGCDAVCFGPSGNGAHQDDEWVDIKSLVDYYQILKKFLLSIK